MKVAYLFPGQGAQAVGMGKDLYEKYESAARVFDEAESVLGRPIKDLIFEGPAQELTLTKNSQPALAIMSLATLAAIQQTLGDRFPKAEYMAGHSLGEYPALAASGALTSADAIRLVGERGRLMYEAGLEIPGTMAAIIALSKEAVAEVCEGSGIYIANLNCPGQIVVSGEKEKVLAARPHFRAKGAKLVIPLQVSGAFHSPVIRAAADGLRPLIEQADIRVPQVPVIGNTEAKPLETTKQIRSELVNQVCASVLWEDTIRYLIAQGVDTFIEIGAGRTLCDLIARTDPTVKTLSIGKVEDIESFSL